MTRVLIDLTDLELWDGHHGGTQRVVYGIAKEFYSQSTVSQAQKVGFIAFSDIDHTFHVTDFNPIYDRVELQKSQAQTSLGPTKRSLKSRIKQRVRPYVPERIRSSNKARHVASKVATSVYSSARKAQVVTSRYARSSNMPMSKKQPIIFHKDDVVLILGKPWDNLDIQKTLTSQKEQVGFSIVQVVYDLIIPLQPQLHHPALFTAYTRNMFEAVCISDALLPISESSARDLKEFCKRLNLRLPKVNVIRLGDDIVDKVTVTAQKPDARINDKFIACVGTIEIRKNHSLLYYAYKLAQEQGIDLPQLVIVGGRGWLSSDLQYLIQHDPTTKEKIIILDNVNDAGLSWIYEHCLYTVYPSMYEGWGLPVAESLAYGKLCLASHASSIPEIAGDLIDYFSPYSSEECLSLMDKYLSEKLRKPKEQLIVERYKPTSWHNTYQQIEAVVSNLVEGV